GRVRPIAVTGARRSPAIPEIPTVAESGVPGFEAASWYGIAGPAGLPAQFVTLFNGELARISGEADFREHLAREGLEPLHTTPAEFRKVIADDIAKWGKVVKAAKISTQ